MACRARTGNLGHGSWRRTAHILQVLPEVSFDRYRWFASHLAYHADEIDSDCASHRLANEGAGPGDWRWVWASVTPMHYSDCPLYSPLVLGLNEIKKNSQIGFR